MSSTPPVVKFYQDVSGFTEAGREMGVFVTSHTLVDKYPDAPYEYSEAIICWLPPAVIGARSFHSETLRILYKNFAYRRCNIYDFFADLKNDDNRQPHAHEDGGFCAGGMGKLEDLVKAGMYKEALARAIAITGSVTHSSGLPVGVRVCRQCGSVSAGRFYTHCGAFWCIGCIRTSAVSGDNICPRCWVEYEPGVFVKTSEGAVGISKCEVDGVFITPGRAFQRPCCGKTTCRAHGDYHCESPGCGKVHICREHIVVRNKLPRYVCQECDAKLRAIEEGVQVCLGCQMALPVSSFYRHGKTVTGYTLRCKDCMKAQRESEEHEAQENIPTAWARISSAAASFVTIRPATIISDFGSSSSTTRLYNQDVPF